MTEKWKLYWEACIVTTYNRSCQTYLKMSVLHGFLYNGHCLRQSHSDDAQQDEVVAAEQYLLDLLLPAEGEGVYNQGMSVR